MGNHIIIDIGHARGTGARGNGLEEHERCVLLAEALETALLKRGFGVTVVDFPDLSNSADLTAAVAAANAQGCDFGISLHMDSASKITGYRRVTNEDGETCEEAIYEPNPVPHGAHCCYYSTTGEAMGRKIASRLCALLPGRAEPVVRRTDLYVLKQTVAPWVLCECGFITNPEDAAMEPQRVAEAIAEGVADYFAQA